jgi:uncharacterized protein YbjQ (UPF0145 family)
MKKLLFVLLAAAAACASARDTWEEFPIKDALESPAAKSKLDPDIKLYFAGQPHPRVLRSMGEWKTNKKTNAFNKSARAACEWTFLSAMLEFQERAIKEGGNAVINIRSNYRNEERASSKTYTCGHGALMSGAAFKGTVVKLAR